MATYYRGRPLADTKFIVHPHYATQQEASDEAIGHQPYRTTPLILPGAKVKKEVVPNECYLRHHPNPSMRGRAPHVEENFLRQKHGDNYLNRVVGDTGNKIAHKQFNSPIGLYSDGNIEQTIRSTVPHTTPIFIDLSFLEEKNRILAEQQRKQRIAQQNRLGRTHNYQPFSFNHPPSH